MEAMPSIIQFNAIAGPGITSGATRYQELHDEVYGYIGRFYHDEGASEENRVRFCERSVKVIADTTGAGLFDSKKVDFKVVNNEGDDLDLSRNISYRLAENQTGEYRLTVAGQYIGSLNLCTTSVNATGIEPFLLKSVIVHLPSAEAVMELDKEPPLIRARTKRDN
ncbi:hypothetical protein [Parendozoicomonas haliclonae]|uniref:Uncharacterized protein n=1 Tax=Parendozoicomonas haliclonae TaxID=1960125 RepID=A0A1X7AKD9_9GAMM|nr:hypothetical protein [Parendozoicomonas haliclonae]SMA47288.1 hypothetical protein EHSB41UT_02363 [Parendozoicomonas haliclonae]